jgi:hypothetical protein
VLQDALEQATQMLESTTGTEVNAAPSLPYFSTAFRFRASLQQNFETLCTQSVRLSQQYLERPSD